MNVGTQFERIVAHKKRPRRKAEGPQFTCFQAFFVTTRAYNDAIKVYVCALRCDRGGMVCPSSLRREISLIDCAVVNWVRERVLTESYVADVIAEVRRRIEARASTNEADRDELERQAKKLREEVDKFAE